ncbi:tIGR00255 family protein [Firmicutes bacterium CAG:475]|nr:tIGR00255 family protein [Firmicutes bacterium CAG:475]
MHSMTGYGKGVSKRDGKTITIEIKTVNHRFLDCNIKLPRNFLFVEDRVKKAVSSAISRGHVDLYLTYEQSSTDEGAYTVDLELANNYLTAVRQLENGTGLANDVTLSTLLRVGDIVTRQQSVEDEDLLAEMTLEAASEALVNLKVMREKEGQSQKADIASKLGTIEACLDRIKEFAPKVVEDYRELLNARIAEVVEPSLVDKQRLATEVALYADHCAIDEEITRLSTHISNMRSLLEATEPVGRKMDFLVQEFNRETNTIGSKANDMRITKEVLAIKNEIEKMREQAANIE